MNKTSDYGTPPGRGGGAQQTIEVSKGILTVEAEGTCKGMVKNGGVHVFPGHSPKPLNVVCIGGEMG